MIEFSHLWITLYTLLNVDFTGIIYIINTIPTSYPPKPVDIRTVVLQKKT